MFDVGEQKLNNGWKAFIKYRLPPLHIDEYPLKGYFFNEDMKVNMSASWSVSGRYSEISDELDLKLPLRELWENKYHDYHGGLCVYHSKEMADQYCNRNRVECVRYVELPPGYEIVKIEEE